MTVIISNAPDYTAYRHDVYNLAMQGYKWDEKYFPNVYDIPNPDNPEEKVKYPGVFAIMDFQTPVPDGKIMAETTIEYRHYQDIMAWSVDGVTPAPPIVDALYKIYYPVI